jgi:hypothetical protein
VLELKLCGEANWIGRKDAKNGMGIPENERIVVEAAINVGLAFL